MRPGRKVCSQGEWAARAAAGLRRCRRKRQPAGGGRPSRSTRRESVVRASCSGGRADLLPRLSLACLISRVRDDGRQGRSIRLTPFVCALAGRPRAARPGGSVWTRSSRCYRTGNVAIPKLPPGILCVCAYRNPRLLLRIAGTPQWFKAPVHVTVKATGRHPAYPGRVNPHEGETRWVKPSACLSECSST
jgi:hypothetical protein